MATAKVKYGSVLVSTGLIITGVLWPQRKNATVRGEDLAEAASAVFDIATVAYSQGDIATNGPAKWYVSDTPKWELLYECMCKARKMLTQVRRLHDTLPPPAEDTAVPAPLIATETPALLWLDPSLPEPADGDLLCENGADWRVRPVTNSFANAPFYRPGDVYPNPSGRIVSYELGDMTNCTDLLPTAAARTPEAGASYQPWLPPDSYNPADLSYKSRTAYQAATWDGSVTPSNSPLSDILFHNLTEYTYDVPLGAPSLGVAWMGGNIWKRLGLGTNVYKYACEKYWDERISMQVVGGEGVAPTPANELLQTQARWKDGNGAITFAIKSSIEEPRRYFAGAIKISSDRHLDFPLYASVNVAGTDVDPTNGVPVIVEDGAIPAPVADPEHAWPTTMPMLETNVVKFTLQRPGGGMTVYFKAFGGITCLSNSATFTWDESTNRASVYVPIVASRIIGPEDCAGCLRFTYDDVEHYRSVYINNVDRDTEPWSSSPHSIVTLAQGGSADITLRSSTTNIEYWTDRTIKTNNLNQLKTVVNAMTRSMYICAPSDVTGGVTNYTHSWGGYSSNIIGAAATPAFSHITLAAAKALAEASVPTTLTNGAPVTIAGRDWPIASLDASADTEERYYYTDAFLPGDPTPYDVHDMAHATCHASVYEFEGCQLPYPSQYACASGYVSKATIFAVCSGELALQDSVFAEHWDDMMGDAPSRLDTCSASGTQGDLSNASLLDFGIMSHVAEIKTFTASADVTTGLDALDPGWLYGGVGAFRSAKLKLAKIAEFNSPTNRPVFSIAARGLVSWPFFAWADQSVECYGEWEESGDNHEQYGRKEEALVDATLYLNFFIVVVDWNWKHLNDASPYVPTLRSPEWATTNTP